MKKHFILFAFLLLMMGKVFSQTVYVTQSGDCYHTSKCKMINKNSESMQLYQALGHGYKPCKKCKPPTKETKAVKKKHTSKPAK